MDRITQNNLDQLVSKVTMHLTKIVEESLKDIDGIKLVSEKDIAGISERSIRETAIATRIRLHSKVWVEDVIVHALQIAKSTVSGKIKRAAKGVPRRGSLFF